MKLAKCKAPAFVAGTFLLISALSGQANAETIAIGKPAPNFTAVDINGRPQSLATYRGKIVVIDWVDPDCGYDSKHYKSGNIPAMQTEAKNENVIWLSINSAAPGNQGDLSGSQLQDWIKSVKWDGQAYIRDSSGTIGHLYHATATPNFYVINQKGILVYAGAIDSIPSQEVADIPKATNYVRNALSEVLANKPVTTPVTRPYGCTIKYAGVH